MCNTMQCDEGGGRELNRVHMSPKRACHRVEKRPVYLACIHMQIPIDMTTFTYCIFALGHILARQFPIVGFRPPVRLIDIIGRAADTRLHFYLHTFANQFEPNRSSVLALLHHPPSLPRPACVLTFFVPLLCRRLANDFRFGRRALRAVIRVSYFSARKCTQGAGATSIDASDLPRGRGCDFAWWYRCNLLRVFRGCYLGIHRDFLRYMSLNELTPTSLHEASTGLN